MNDAEAEVEKLKAVCPEAALWEEPDGKPLVHLPRLKFRSGGTAQEVDCLLCPRDRDGYSTRLFLKQSFPGKGQNWKSTSICGHTWWVCSYNGVPASLPWVEILASHLRVLQ